MNARAIAEEDRKRDLLIEQRKAATARMLREANEALREINGR
jgi:hypothetical protein